ncbi:MAG: flippase-like domain-containing protein [Candidatus Aminicenantes bacterium]|nr:flippase-like domain-containing protein [Candidatus Aminicenantes bacterium]
MSPRSAPRVRLFRFAAMLIIGVGSLFVLKELGYLDLGAIAEAFRRKGFWIGLVVLSLAGLLLLSAIRFFILAKALRLPVRFPDVLAANLVGQAVGQWLPGSLALTEILRFGVMAKLRVKGEAETVDFGAGPKGRLGLAIIIDRLLGLGAMFAVGGLAGFWLLAVKNQIAPVQALAVGLLSALSLVLGLAALAAPFRSNRLIRKAVLKISGSEPVRGDDPEASPRGIRGFVRRSARKILQILEAAEQLQSGGNRASVPLLLSLAAALFNPLTLYFASIAAGPSLPFPVILAAIPFTVAAIFLPSGIAGFGGPQLLAAGVFPLFGADPGIVVTACLLQNTIVLAGQTVGGALGVALLSDRITLRPGKRD